MYVLMWYNIHCVYVHRDVHIDLKHPQVPELGAR